MADAGDIPDYYYGAEQFKVTATVDGVFLGQFTRFTGGDLDSEPTSLHPGGMRPAVVTGSRRTMSDITLSKPYGWQDSGRIYNMLDKVGRARVTCTKQPLSPDGNLVKAGVGFTYTGVLKGITLPEYDADSTDPATWSIVITPDDEVGTVNT
jgi:hypothetical protein